MSNFGSFLLLRTEESCVVYQGRKDGFFWPAREFVVRCEGVLRAETEYCHRTRGKRASSPVTHTVFFTTHFAILNFCMPLNRAKHAAVFRLGANMRAYSSKKLKWIRDPDTTKI